MHNVPFPSSTPGLALPVLQALHRTKLEAKSKPEPGKGEACGWPRTDTIPGGRAWGRVGTPSHLVPLSPLPIPVTGISNHPLPLLSSLIRNSGPRLLSLWDNGADPGHLGQGTESRLGGHP